MYPSPASAYRPQIQQPQLIPQISNQNSQPPPTYPYPQYNNNSNTAANTTPLSAPTYPGQPPPMPYATGGNTANATNQQVNGSFSVSLLINKFNFNTISYFRIIIIII